MTIEVKAGDVTVTFPDDTPTETIRQAMARATGQSTPSRPTPSILESLARGAGEGLTLGFGDEIGALDRAAQQASRQANPWTHFAGEAIGSIAPMVGAAFIPGGQGATAAQGASLLARGASLARAAFAPRAVTSFSTAAREGARLGGSYGAVTGVGHADSPNLGDRITGGVAGAVTGAAGGAVLSPALYTLGTGARAGYNALADYWNTGGMQTGLRKTIDALERQATTPDALATQLVAGASPAVRAMHTTNPGMLADILGLFRAGRTATDVAREVSAAHGVPLTPQQVGAVNAGFGRGTRTPRDLLALSEEVGGSEAGRSGLTSMMQAVASVPGRGREIALRRMGATMEEAPDRLVQALSRETGADTNFRGALATRQAQRAQDAQRAYTAADQQYVVDTISGAAPTVQQLIEPILIQYTARAANLTGERQGAMRRALEIMSGMGSAPTPPAGQLRIQTLADFRAARQELDTLIRELGRSADAPSRDASRILGGMRRDLNTAVGQAHTALAAADRQFATATAREEAMELGRQYTLRVGTRHDEILREMRALERRFPTHVDELRESMMMGIMRNMADEIATSGGVPPSWMRPMTGGVRPSQVQALDAVLAAPVPGAPIAARSRPAIGQVAGQPVPNVQGFRQSRRVMDIVAGEARLRRIFQAVWGNSNTAGKMAAIEDLRELPRIAAEIATGGLSGLKDAIARRLMNAITERNATEIARVVTETDPRALYVALHQMNEMLPGVRRAGEVVGGVASVGPAVGTAVAGAAEADIARADRQRREARTRP